MDLFTFSLFKSINFVLDDYWVLILELKPLSLIAFCYEVYSNKFSTAYFKSLFL